MNGAFNQNGNMRKQILERIREVESTVTARQKRKVRLSFFELGGAVGGGGAEEHEDARMLSVEGIRNLLGC